MKQYAVYLRVSTQRQGAQGLGISAQRDMCDNFIKQNKGEQVREFMDVESGTHRDRKGLWQAIDFCKKNGCSLVIAKLDRMSRDVEFTFKVINTGIDIHFTDMPVVNSMVLGVFAAVAQYEREMCSLRTKQALAAKKARGEKLGGGTDKWKESHDAKSMLELREEQKRRACSKVKTYLMKKDTKAFIKVLQRVFPTACDGNVEDWHEWYEINTKGDNKRNIIRAMMDMKELDPTGEVFSSWDFNGDGVKLQVRLATTINTLRKSVSRYRVYLTESK